MTAMHQIEVKRYLIEKRFPPAKDWEVVVDLDVMELGRGNQNTQEKRQTAEKHHKWMQDNRVTVHVHKKGTRTDILAKHPEHGTYIVECEGDTSKQRDQAMYSALGQLLLQMHNTTRHYALAFPNTEGWIAQVGRIPRHVRDILRFTVFMVANGSVEEK